MAYLLIRQRNKQVYSCSAGSRCTFDITSRVKLSGLSLYCIARTLCQESRHSIGLAGATRLTLLDFMLHIGADLLYQRGRGAWQGIENKQYIFRTVVSLSFVGNPVRN